MIRLRATLEQALRHRWLGPIVFLLVALVLSFLALHPASDGHFDAASLCAAVALLAVVQLLIVAAAPLGRAPSVVSLRAPPRSRSPASRQRPFSRPVVAPLRL